VARIVQIVLVALIAIGLAAAPCPACNASQPAQPPAAHRCCHHAPGHSAPAPHCGWMPADHGPTEAKADTVKVVPTPASVAELTAITIHPPLDVRALPIASDAPPGAQPSSLITTLRC
jgi:hypothetical protein